MMAREKPPVQSVGKYGNLGRNNKCLKILVQKHSAQFVGIKQLLRVG